VALLTAAAARLSDAGAILFSTNYRRFSLDADAVIPFLTGEEITGQTIPFDFSRNARIHRVWLFRKKHNKSEVSS
jgi:23S rRNA (guanine2445-N2)-methyltransferase / 23S rRNA (guanine2069-N7)-methyltransferase